jgi:hypothetical protein
MHISINPGWSLTTENFAGAISILFTPIVLLAEQLAMSHNPFEPLPRKQS